jgi:phosphoglycolate phosphatase
MSQESASKVKRLVLFDIDETMISSDGAGRRALTRALSERHGLPEELCRVNMSGKTDPQILSEIFAASSLTLEGEALQKEIQHVIELYLEFLDEEIPASKYYIVHSGVPALLERLSVEDNAYLGLLTGNVERGARKKLKQFDLNKYFDIGAYGSDSASRLDLPAVAVGRALTHFKKQFSPEEVVIIGDSVNDIACAHHYGATALIANTGRTTWEELEAHKPRYLFKDLANVDEVMAAIFN